MTSTLLSIIFCAATTLAKSEAFEYYAKGESLTADKSAAAVFVASGETIVTAKSESVTYKAVGDILVLGTSSAFTFQAVGEAPVRTQELAIAPGKVAFRLSAGSLRERSLVVETEFEPSKLRFRYWKKLTDEPSYLEPTTVEVDADGAIFVEVEIPVASSGFIQPVLIDDWN